MVLSQTISLDYKLIKDLPFSFLCTTIHGKLDLGPYSNSPNPTANEYLELIASFNTAVSSLALGLHSAKLERNRTRDLLEAATQSLSGYAVATTPGRPDQWVQAGFPLTKGETTARLPSQPVTGFKLNDGKAERSIQASCDVQAGMYGYIWRLRPKNGPTGRFCYETLISREASVLITGLDAETTYCVECAAWNNTGVLQWSTALSRIVQ